MQSVRSVKDLEGFKGLVEQCGLKLSQKELEAYWLRMGKGYRFYIEQLRDGQKYSYVAKGKREGMRKFGAIVFSRAYNYESGEIKDEFGYKDRILLEVEKVKKVKKAKVKKIRKAKKGILGKVFKELNSSAEKINKEKIALAKKLHVHIFNGGKCVVCGKSLEQVKKKDKQIEIEWDGYKIKAYEGCRGGS